MYSATGKTNPSVTHFLNFQLMLTLLPLTELAPKWCSALGKCLRALLRYDTSLNPGPSTQDKLFMAFTTSSTK